MTNFDRRPVFWIAYTILAIVSLAVCFPTGTLIAPVRSRTAENGFVRYSYGMAVEPPYRELICG